MSDWIIPQWDVPPHVHAVSTLRNGGVSEGRFASLNLGLHVGDETACVQENRNLLTTALKLPAQPLWLDQHHGCTVVRADNAPTRHADASFTSAPGTVCAIMTADCLPVLLCDSKGSRVAAIHAGWRGLAHGIIETSVRALGDDGDLVAWLGPAIGADAFEVGDEVRSIFTAQLGEAAGMAFKPHKAGNKWYADIYALARFALRHAGVNAVYGGERCTYSEPEHFFSFRRDGQTGRMATLIWLE
jgi:YfiH family protein